MNTVPGSAVPRRKSAIIVGASSGIGLEIARLLAHKGYRLGVAARRWDLLKALQAETDKIVAIEGIDVTKDDIGVRFAALWESMGKVDEVYVVSGVGHLNEKLDWSPEAETILTNANGFAHLCVAAMQRFEKQGHGHLIGISSVAALRGAWQAPAYGATKAFVSRYLQALRMRARRAKVPIYVTDVRPGFVETAMMKGDTFFWVASPKKAAQQIVQAVARKRAIVYVTKRWAILGALLRLLPE